MKIKQRKIKFEPITLIIETLQEAEEFMDLVDNGNTRSSIAIKLSDAITNGVIEIPNNVSDDGFIDL